MRLRRRFCMLAVSVAAISVGCGSDDEGTIPKDAGGVLITRLDEVRGAVESGNCEGAEASARLFTQQVEELPEEVDSEVKDALVSAGARMIELLVEEDPAQCEPSGVTGVTGVQPPIEETIEPPPTTTTTEETTTTAEEDQEDREDDRERDGGGGGGDGGSGGGGTGGTGGTGTGGD